MNEYPSYFTPVVKSILDKHMDLYVDADTYDKWYTKILEDPDSVTKKQLASVLLVDLICTLENLDELEKERNITL